MRVLAWAHPLHCKSLSIIFFAYKYWSIIPSIFHSHEASPAPSSDAPPPPGYAPNHVPAPTTSPPTSPDAASYAPNQAPALIASPPIPPDAASQGKKIFTENDIDPDRRQNLSNRAISQTLRWMNRLQSGIVSNPTSVSASSAKFAALGMFIPSCRAKDGATSKKNGPQSKKHSSQSKKHKPLSKKW